MDREPRYLVIVRGLVWKVTRLESEADHYALRLRKVGMLAYVEVE